MSVYMVERHVPLQGRERGHGQAGQRHGKDSLQARRRGDGSDSVMARNRAAGNLHSVDDLAS